MPYSCHTVKTKHTANKLQLKLHSYDFDTVLSPFHRPGGGSTSMGASQTASRDGTGKESDPHASPDLLMLVPLLSSSGLA